MPLLPTNPYDGRIRNLMDLLHNPMWITSKTSHADHIEPVSSFANLAMANDLDNIQTLCRRCHDLKTAGDK